MSRSLPADMAALVQPVSDNFNPVFEDRITYVRWAETLDVSGVPVSVELGYSKAGGRADTSVEDANLRASAWQATELARLGRRDLLAYCTVGRFKQPR